MRIVTLRCLTLPSGSPDTDGAVGQNRSEAESTLRAAEEENGETVAVEELLMPFYDDDGTEINPNLIPKPSLCTSCAKDDDPSEETLCSLNRLDQQGEDEFRCDAYVANDLPEED